MLMRAAGRAVGDAVDGEADAVDRDRALDGEEARQRRAAPRPRSSHDSPTAPKRADPADAVDMAADEMAVEPVVGAHRLLEVDLAGGVEAGGLVEALGRDLDREAMRAPASRRTTVMQAPERAMLSPSATSSRKPGGASIASALAEGRAGCRAGSTSTMRPMPLTMPVNMASIVAAGAAAPASRRRQRAGRRRRRRSSPTGAVSTMRSPGSARAARAARAPRGRGRGRAARGAT